MRAGGYPAYTTSIGWIGYSDEKVRRLCREGVAAGWRHFKVKVGKDVAADIRRLAIIREEIGPDRFLMIDANQAWDVDQAIDWVRALAPARPWWIEEPTSPDDVLGHARIARELAPLGIRVATGEHCQNRVMFKQLLQAEAIGFCQLDSCRLGGVNEVLAVQLLAAKFGIPVCPHAGGVGLCEYVQHLAIFDYIAVSGSLEDRVVEYVDHLHEHFVDPASVRDGRYVAADRARLQHHDATRIARTIRVPGRPRMDPACRPGGVDHDGSPRGQGLPHHRRRFRHRARHGAAVRGRGCEVAVADIDARRPPRRWHDRGRRGTRRRRLRSTSPTPNSTEALAAASWPGSAGSTSCSTTPGSPGSASVHETSVELWDRVMAVNVRGVFLVARAVAAGHDRRRPRLDHQHVVDDRRDRPGQPRVVRRVEGRGPVADPADAGRLRGRRHPGQRPPAGHDPHAVRRSLPRARATTTRWPVSRPSRSGS